MRHFNCRALPGMLFVFALALAILAAAGCAESPAEPSDPAPDTPAAAAPEETPDPLAQAAAEATTIVQRAEATALVLQAEALAAEIQEAAAQEMPKSQDDGGAAALDAVPTQEAAAPDSTTQAGPASTTEPSIEIISVGFAGEGGFIHVQFLAPPAVARRWNQGLVSVTDEETGIAYVEVPIMPVLGALIGKPIKAGQPGYVMLVNGPVPIGPGARVTVKLGNYVEEGLIVRG